MVKAILKTNDPAEGYEVVDVIKNPINDRNGLALIERDGERYMTGGILCEVDSGLMLILDSMTNTEQWQFLLRLKAPKVFV